MVRQVLLFALLSTVALAQLVNVSEDAKKGKIELGKEFKGHFTYYEDGGYGACGSKINAKKEKLVAISSQYFTNKNRSKDPACDNVCLEVRYKDKKIKVPVKDECPPCAKNHMDLSLAAYKALEPNTDIGDVTKNVYFKFVNC
ncbi:hypothetical protein L596_019372 [Steinernema carpocapsae]|uniref:RlpA-like protein double-psi beta-barrel domain-containing protein n=1 Tax=Steinernema carpocapsae TaxID=34508 RepID=A0A4U5MQB4_STECR|nr:hypothetical protein L596_019372 [Steinernema carpocapsae]